MGYDTKTKMMIYGLALKIQKLTDNDDIEEMAKEIQELIMYGDGDNNDK